MGMKLLRDSETGTLLALAAVGLLGQQHGVGVGQHTPEAMMLALTAAQWVAVKQAAAAGQSGGGSPAAGRSGSRTSRRMTD